MLDLAVGATWTGRRACRNLLTPELDGQPVRLPPEHSEVQGR